jgi:hypothetical protein
MQIETQYLHALSPMRELANVRSSSPSHVASDQHPVGLETAIRNHLLSDFRRLLLSEGDAINEQNP